DEYTDDDEHDAGHRDGELIIQADRAGWPLPESEHDKARAGEPESGQPAGPEVGEDPFLLDEAEGGTDEGDQDDVRIVWLLEREGEQGCQRGPEAGERTGDEQRKAHAPSGEPKRRRARENSVCPRAASATARCAAWKRSACRSSRSPAIRANGVPRSPTSRPRSSSRHRSEIESWRSPGIDDGVPSNTVRPSSDAASYSPRPMCISARCHKRWFLNHPRCVHGSTAGGRRVMPVSNAAIS